jgi:hypothetical protein
MQIQSSIKVSNEYRQSQRVFDGKENLSSGFESEVKVEAALLNAQDARTHYVERNASETGIVLCMSKADAAKPYKHRQSQLLDSIEFMALLALKTAHPKQKNEARRKTDSLWARMLADQGLLEGWGMGSDISKARDFRDAMEDDYKDYCQNAKLHWKPDKENLYSEMAFAKLSRKLKIEKSPCAGRGISLAYKNSESKCEHVAIFSCSVQPSLLLASCDGTEYGLLNAPAIGGFNQNESVALERMRARLRGDSFWGLWEQEIKQWSPQCE